ncbi:MAG: DUF3198 domain-containing protein [Thermoplasmatales archaeon]|nr:DUF3198 domain-containing protein [Thermoplasmatales archaeon]
MNKIFREYMLMLSAILFGVGIIMTVIGFLWCFTVIQLNTVNPSLEEFSEKLGNWGWWILIPAPFILIAGGWYFSDQLLARKKFNKMISTNSKASLVKNIGEVEGIMWKLPRKYEVRFEEKKKKFKIK